MKYALALSGGAAKGAWQVPIIQRLYDAYGAPVIQMGTSVGACNVSLPPDELEKFWRDIKGKKDFQRISLNPWQGLYTLKPLRKMHDKADSIKTDIPTYVGVYSFVDQEHRMQRIDNMEVHTARDFAVASSALPIVHQQWRVGNELLCDGGVWSVTGRLPTSDTSTDPVFVVWCQPPFPSLRHKPTKARKTNDVWETFDHVFDAWMDRVAAGDVAYWQWVARTRPVYMFFPESWEDIGKSFDADPKTTEARFALGMKAPVYQLSADGRINIKKGIL